MFENLSPDFGPGNLYEDTEGFFDLNEEDIDLSAAEDFSFEALHNIVGKDSPFVIDDTWNEKFGMEYDSTFVRPTIEYVTTDVGDDLVIDTNERSFGHGVLKNLEQLGFILDPACTFSSSQVFSLVNRFHLRPLSRTYDSTDKKDDRVKGGMNLEVPLLSLISPVRKAGDVSQAAGQFKVLTNNAQWTNKTSLGFTYQHLWPILCEANLRPHIAPLTLLGKEDGGSGIYCPFLNSDNLLQVVSAMNSPAKQELVYWAMSISNDVRSGEESKGRAEDLYMSLKGIDKRCLGNVYVPEHAQKYEIDLDRMLASQKVCVSRMLDARVLIDVFDVQRRNMFLSTPERVHSKLNIKTQGFYEEKAWGEIRDAQRKRADALPATSVDEKRLIISKYFRLRNLVPIDLRVLAGTIPLYPAKEVREASAAPLRDYMLGRGSPSGFDLKRGMDRIWKKVPYDTIVLEEIMSTPGPKTVLTLDGELAERITELSDEKSLDVNVVDFQKYAAIVAKSIPGEGTFPDFTTGRLVRPPEWLNDYYQIGRLVVDYPCMNFLKKAITIRPTDTGVRVKFLNTGQVRNPEPAAFVQPYTSSAKGLLQRYAKKPLKFSMP